MTINLNHVANQVTTTGSATNIGPIFQAKGSGSFTFRHIGNDSYPGYVFTGSDSLATTMTFSTVGITMSGFAADIPITFTTKGISPVTLSTALGAHLKAGRVNSDTGSIVNYWQFSGSKTNEGVMMYALGSDTNISAYYYAKGTGGHIFNTSGTNVVQFGVAHTASAVNYLQATGAPSFNSPALSAQGSNSDISILLAPKGVGTVVVTGSGGIQLNGSTSGWVGFKSPATAGAITYTLPSGDGTNGQVLATNGNATLSWATAGGGSAPTFNSVGSYVLGYCGSAVTAGSNYSAGGGGTQITSAATDGTSVYTINNLSGTWKAMGGSANPAASLFCRVS